jgi:hypothetical protein
MTKVILDQASLATFDKLKDRTEVCDATGRVLGYFTPLGCYSLYEEARPTVTEEELQRRERLAYQIVKVPFSQEELDQFAREPGGRTLAAILADLEKRA